MALTTASNMDVRLYAWSIDPVMSGRLGADSEYKVMLIVKQRRRDKLILLERKRKSV